MTRLTDDFARRAHANAFTIEREGRYFVFRASSARTDLVEAYLEIAEGDDVLGYLTEWGNDQAGVSRADQFGYGLPRIVNTAEEAIDEVTAQ